MAEMDEMEMPLPDNTLPMMTGFGPFGPLEMGGMFTVVKVREGLAANDFKDPGWYKHPEGTVAYELADEPTAPRCSIRIETTRPTAEVNVVKPKRGSHAGHRLSGERRCNG
jgi:hypothetical protein